ncbi:MAG TPA: hypothetical protein VGD37_17195 [Kofleriaceae bacterium]
MVLAAAEAAAEAAAREAHARIAGALMALPGVHGVAVGRKQTGGASAGGEPCVAVFVDRKRPLDQLAANERIPAVVPGTAVPTDVVEYPRVIAQVARAVELRPARPASRSARAPRRVPVPRELGDLGGAAEPDAEADTALHAVLAGGAQIQSYGSRGSVGTLGTVLYDTRHRRLIGLGNWHALYPWPSPGGAGDAIYQPSFSARN